MKHLRFIDQHHLQDHIFPRSGETKLGEAVQLLDKLEALSHSEAKFVIIGIMEDIGVRANLGRPGCANAFQHLLGPLCNIQVNRFLNGSDIALGPVLDFKDLMEEAQHLDANQEADLKRLRALTSEIDAEVAELIKLVVEANAIPIVIGGGHNNAYGIIKGVSQGLDRSIDVLNIDPHADYRSLEGRHSGNGFRYARQDGFLRRYAVFGMHESYNNQDILEQFRSSADLYYLTYDELLTFSTEERDRLFKDALRWLGQESIGLELDMDSITAYPASALNASGFTMRQARTLVKTAAALGAPSYFHIAEAAPDLAPNSHEAALSAKAIVYLISDFIKSHHVQL
ncbi:MAG: formimidoylglutamase [Bacteroidetes bacterium]|nr:formimidoylglutamase [Bacteroidota bacterium]